MSDAVSGGAHPAAVQLQVFGIPVNNGSGDIEVLPQGAAFGNTATLVFLGNIAFTTASTTARVNPATNQIDVQVRLGSADVAIDLVGYFSAPDERKYRGPDGRHRRCGDRDGLRQDDFDRPRISETASGKLRGG